MMTALLAGIIIGALGRDVWPRALRRMRDERRHDDDNDQPRLPPRPPRQLP